MGDEPLLRRWTQLQRSAINEVRILDRQSAIEVQTAIRSGVGPLVQRLDRELRRFPRHDQVEVGRLAARIERALTSRRNKVAAILGDLAPATAAWLTGALDEFGAEVRDRIARCEDDEQRR